MESALPIAVAAGGALLAARAIDKRYKITKDLKFIKTFIKLKMGVSRMERNDLSVSDLFEETVDRHPNKRAIVFANDGSVITFAELDKAANRMAHWALSVGLKRGDVVAIFMTNRPEFVATWLGLAKVGIVSAFINHNLVGSPLMHCIRVSHARAILFDEPLRSSIDGVRGEFASLSLESPLITASYEMGGTTHGGVGQDVNLSRVLPTLSAARPDKSFRTGTAITDTFGFVYTSGTTGMPKAAIISHLRFFLAGTGFMNVFQLSPDDTVYTVLPLYHSAGGMIGAGLVIFGGLTMVLRDKFSATRFWSDCTEYRCTVMQYIGELCRYLLLTKPSPAERTHHLRIAVGNGLRPDIWGDFQSRFNIPEVGEFYGSTEGNVALFNHCTDEESRGAVGVAGILQRLANFTPIVKFDDDTEKPVRGPDGFCIQCGPNEVGEMLGVIKENDPTRKFQGYHGNKEATEKKIIRDVFSKGDVYFRTGDLLKRDDGGYFHFVDRIGDTFRWKGENVATTEVAEVVSAFPGIAETNVYGVAIPGKDGRAGCAALTLTMSGPGSSPTASGETVPIDVAGLAAHCSKNLPPYAVPVFLRILPEVPITGTFKHQKVQLRKEGADPSVVSDPLFWFNPASGVYEPLDAPTYLKLATSHSKL